MRSKLGLGLSLTLLATSLTAIGCSAHSGADDPSVDEQTIAGAVTLTASAVSSKEVDLSWTTSVNNITSFAVQRGTSSSSLTTVTTLTAPATSYKDTAVSANTTYYYRVVATKGSVHYGSPVVPILVAPTDTCGDGICADAETCTSCAADCGACPASCVNAGPTWQNSAFAPQTGPFTVQFDATPSAANIDAVTGLSAATATWYTDLAAIVRFNASGGIDARNGGDYAAASSIPYSAGTTYHFRMVVDIASHKYSAYVTPAGGGEVVIGTNFAFRTEQAAAASLGNLAAYDDIGTHTVCGFALSGAPSQPDGGTDSGGTDSGVDAGTDSGNDGGACVPNNAATCSGKSCGSATNNCGQSISCGTCSSGQSCVNNVCISPPTGKPWYVRPGGAGSKSGTDWNNAWDIAAIGWSSLSAGDTVWLAGGTYATPLVFKKNGITVKRATSQDTPATSAAGWNASSFDKQAVMPSNVSLNGGGIGAGQGFSNIALDGSVQDGILINHSGSSSAEAGIYFGDYGAMSSITLKYIRINAPTNIASPSGTGINVSLPYQRQGDPPITNILMNHVTVDGLVVGIMFTAVKDVVVEYSQILNSVWAPGCTPSTCEHTDWVFFWGGGNYSSNVTFRYNRFYNMWSQGVFYNTSSGDPQWFSNFLFTGNTFDGLYGGHCIWPDGNGLNVINNTFYRCSYGVGYGRSMDAAGAIIENNIFYDANEDPYDATDDYNGFYNAANGPTCGSNCGTPAPTEAHGVTLSADSLLSPSTGDFHVSASTGPSYARGKGANLTSLCGNWPSLCIDPDGTQRPASGAWDIGAYQYHP
jgi:hypothetical protein